MGLSMSVCPFYHQVELHSVALQSRVRCCWRAFSRPSAFLLEKCLPCARPEVKGLVSHEVCGTGMEKASGQFGIGGICGCAECVMCLCAWEHLPRLGSANRTAL